MGKKRSWQYEQALKLMGRRVVVSCKLERDEDDSGKIFWTETPLKESRVGWVTGIRWKQVGTIETVNEGGDMFEPGDPYTYFNQEETVPALLVVCWPTEKPLLVPFGGFRVAADVERPKPSTGLPYDDRIRAEMSAWAKEMPRDSRGRFMKWRPS